MLVRTGRKVLEVTNKTTIRINNNMTTEELYRQFETLTVDMVVKENHDILECAAMMMAQAMRIYKTALTPEDYEVMVKTILESRIDITEMEPPTLQ